MRKIIIVVILLANGLSGFSQQFIDGGLKFFAGTTWLINTNIFKDADYSYQVSPGFSFGAKLGYNFNESIQLVAEGYYAIFKQNFAVTKYGANWEKKITMTSIDLPFLIRHNRDNGSYMEIGPQLSLVQGVKETMSDNSIANAADYYDKNYLSVVVGLGSYLMGWGNFGIAWGFKIGYTLSDVVDGTVPEGFYTHQTTTYTSYTATNPLSLGITIEFNYDLGYMVKAPCGKRRSFMLFNN